MSSEPIIIPTGNGTVSLLNDVLVCRDYLGKLLIRCSPQETFSLIVAAKLAYKNRGSARLDALGDGRIMVSTCCGLLMLEFGNYSMSLNRDFLRQLEANLRSTLKGKEFSLMLAAARRQAATNFFSANTEKTAGHQKQDKNRSFYGFIALYALVNLLVIFFCFDQMSFAGRLLHAIIFPSVLIVAISATSRSSAAFTYRPLNAGF